MLSVAYFFDTCSCSSHSQKFAQQLYLMLVFLPIIGLGVMPLTSNHRTGLQFDIVKHTRYILMTWCIMQIGKNQAQKCHPPSNFSWRKDQQLVYYTERELTSMEERKAAFCGFLLCLYRFSLLHHVTSILLIYLKP